MNYHTLIRGNNIIWKLLYYDELIDYPNYQLTYFSHADEAFYNCAQTITRLTDADILAIENYYSIKNTAPAFYTDPLSDPWLPKILSERNYVEIESQKENWWLLELTPMTILKLKTQSFLKLEDHRVTCEIARNYSQFNKFFHINQTTNQLNKSIIMSLKKNIQNNRHDYAKIIHFIGNVDDNSVFCGSVGVLNDCAYFAEGGTLIKHRRQGLHSFMTQQRLLHSYNQGAKLACITCSLDSNTNLTAKKLGFRLAFTRSFFSKIKPANI